jgi:hypothetical protein
MWPLFHRAFSFLGGAMDNIRVRAKATFNSRYGMVRGGEIFWCEEDYAREMEKIGNVTRESVPEPKPQNNRAFKQAPSVGKEQATENLPPPSPLPERTSGERMGSGAKKPAYASPQARRSRKRT